MAEDIGDSNSVVYAIGCLLGFAPCMECLLADKISKARGIDQGMGKHCLCVTFDCCTCFSCALYNEAALHAAAPEGGKMEDR